MNAIELLRGEIDQAEAELSAARLRLEPATELGEKRDRLEAEMRLLLNTRPSARMALYLSTRPELKGS